MPKIVDDETTYRAVIQVIAARGYAGATTKELAKAAGISEMSLFRKYRNKLQLVKQALTSIIDQADFAAATRYTGDITADLLRVVQFYQDSAVKHGQLIFMLVAELPRYPDLADLLTVPLDMFTRIESLLAHYQADGILRQEHPRHAVGALLGPLLYTGTLHRVMPDDGFPPLDLQTHVTHFLAGRRTETE